jgi:hypothetical protein
MIFFGARATAMRAELRKAVTSGFARRPVDARGEIRPEMARPWM